MSPSKIKPITKLFINGEQVPCSSGKQIPLVDPSTGEEWLRVDEAGDEEVELAVKSAEKAWPAWNATHATTKAAALRKLASLILEHAEDLSYLESKTNGKVLSILDFDINVTAGVLNYCAALAETAKSEITTTTPGQLNYVLRNPFGVTAGIIPWNVPMIMFSFKVGPAVAAGNAIILKSSEKAPVTPLILADLAMQAGFPPGIIQVLSGYGPTVGAALASHMRIRKVSFTGSGRTGRLVQQMAAKSNLKNVTLELGGKSPVIVFPDANIGNAVEACMESILSGFGQSCMASTRIYVHTSIKDKFLNAYTAAFKAKTATREHHTDINSTHGPLIDSVQFDRVKSYLEKGREEGTPVIGGNAVDSPGYFIEPTVYVDVAEDASINKEEIFGPVVVIHSFEEESEVINWANDSEYGLYGAVFTKDIDRAMRISSALEAGCVGINCTSPTLTADMPFGGFKASGIGRDIGPDAVRNWQEVKSVFLKFE